MGRSCRPGGTAQAVRIQGGNGTSSTSELGSRVLRRPAPLALLGQDPPVLEQLPAPHAARLLTLEGLGEARLADRALRADGLGPGDVDEVLGEEQRGQRGRAVVAAGLGPPRRRCGDWLGCLELLVVSDGVHVGAPKSSAEKEKDRRVIPTVSGSSRRFRCCLRRRLAEPSGGVGLVSRNGHERCRVHLPREPASKERADSAQLAGLAT